MVNIIMRQPCFIMVIHVLHQCEAVVPQLWSLVNWQCEFNKYLVLFVKKWHQTGIE